MRKASKAKTPVDLGNADLLHPKGMLGLRIDAQRIIKWFFGTNAGIAILVLFLIMLSLLREGSGFLPTYSRELSVYRQAGLEYCDFIKKPLAEHDELASRLRRALGAEINETSRASRDRRDAALLLKKVIEEKTTLQQEPLEEAIAATGTPAANLETLRNNLKMANAAALQGERIPELFNAPEAERLKQDLISLQPDMEEPPPFIKELTDAAAASQQAAMEKNAAFVASVDEFESATDGITDIHEGMQQTALAAKEKAVQLHMAEDAKEKLLEAAASAKDETTRKAFESDAAATVTEAVDFKPVAAGLREKFPDVQKLFADYKGAVEKAVAGFPAEASTNEARSFLKKVRSDLPRHLKHVDESIELMRTWDDSKPIPKVKAAMAFLFGGDWVTNSSWQDFYGVVPLLTGSLVIALVALVIAVPFSVAAAIYTNQFASLREQDWIKPIIEFIQAIPSVVLGFIGISVLGDLIKEISQVSWLSWVPGFPVAERLNMFNAGCLLALMAIPTMFSLAEDALNNVPRSLAEASDALGATKLQTVFRVVVPAANSGIIAALLLGLGRILGETMVVLLVAGNRIAIPNFSDGIGVVFQPAHTLTGIIAQELGEVSRGSSHWQALFMVGILLFGISLIINYLARLAVKRLKLIQG